jgi:hypothetical protein
MLCEYPIPSVKTHDSRFGYQKLDSIGSKNKEVDIKVLPIELSTMVKLG